MMTLEKLMHIHNGLLTGGQQKWMTYGDLTVLDEKSDISFQCKIYLKHQKRSAF